MNSHLLLSEQLKHRIRLIVTSHKSRSIKVVFDKKEDCLLVLNALIEAEQWVTYRRHSTGSYDLHKVSPCLIIKDVSDLTYWWLLSLPKAWTSDDVIMYDMRHRLKPILSDLPDKLEPNPLKIRTWKTGDLYVPNCF